MQDTIYQFRVTAPDVQQLLSQVSRAIEKRTEIEARKKCPHLWKVTDKIRGREKAPKKAPKAVRNKRRRFRKVCSIFNLLMGFVLFIPGLMQPKELSLPLIAGGFAIGAGIVGLILSKETRGNGFETSAKRLLEQQRDIPLGQVQILFSQQGMTLQSKEDIPITVPYSDFDLMLETEDIFLLVYNNKGTILQKKDFVGENLVGFREFAVCRLKLMPL